MKKIIWIVIAAALLIGLTGCDATTTSQSELRAVLESLVLADSTIAINGLEDGSPRPAEYDVEGGLAKAADTLPYNFRTIRFGRRFMAQPEREVELTIAPDEQSAEALVMTTVSGVFFVVTIDTVNHVPVDTVIKPFVQTTRQKLRLEKFRATSNPRRNWRVTALTPILGATANNLIAIGQVSITGSNVNITLSNPVADSLLNIWFERADLPVLGPRQIFGVTMTVTNPDPFIYAPGELAAVHYGINPQVLKFRRILSDPENDDTFTGRFTTANQGARMRTLFLDVIDLRSIFNTEAPFDATFWAIPYRVRTRP